MTRERMGMEDEWVPPAMTGEEYERLTAIETGFPYYVRGQVEEWVTNNAFAADVDFSGREFSPDLPRFLSRIMKHRFDEDILQFGENIRHLSDNDLANVIDCMLFYSFIVEDADDLERMLRESRAGWQISRDENGNLRVTQAQPSGVIQSLEDVMNKTAKAGKLLSEAYESAYGVAPNPNHAYDLSVKAVETLACPKFLPSNKRATLGTVITYLESKPVSLPLIEKNANHRETLTKMMRLLWEGGKRHGEESYEHVSLPGSRTAHSLATCLVAMLHEGVITVP